MLLTECLGPGAAAADMHAMYIASKAPRPELAAEEREVMEATAKAILAANGGVDDPQTDATEMAPRSITVFPRGEDGLPFLWDYQLRGFFKEAAGALKRSGPAAKKAKKAKKGEEDEDEGSTGASPEPAVKAAEFLSDKLTAHKKAVDCGVFVAPRRIPIILPEGVTWEKPEICIRPLRAAGPKGERITLAASEVVPAGSMFEFSVVVLDDGMVPLVCEWFAYGALKGLLQWRNSGRGTFVTRVSEPVPISLTAAAKIVHGDTITNLPERFLQPVLPPTFTG